MKNRSIIARELAAKPKEPVKKVKPKAKLEPVVEEPVVVEEPKELIVALDPESKEVLLTFESFEQAEEEGFLAHNIKSALSTGNKYKGHLWDLSK